MAAEQDTPPAEHPERIDAEEYRGRLIASEHLGRYAWASRLAPGRRVFDAGCGTGYGTAILAGAGAAEVIGADISAAGLAEASALHRDERVTFVEADLRRLDLPDGGFDLIACFEVIEHVEDPEAVLAELARVLAPEGILCISTPNRRVYPAGNPYHLYEYEPEEFAGVLGKHFSHVVLHRQTAWLTSAIFSEPDFAARGLEEASSVRAIKLTMDGQGSIEETFTIAVAGGAPPEELESLIVLGDTFEVRWWEEQIEDAHSEAIDASRDAAQARASVELANAQSQRSAEQLLAVEEIVAHAKAQIFRLEETAEENAEQLDKLRQELSEAKHQTERALTEAKRASRVLEDVMDSVSWRMTSPIRALKRLLVR